MTEIVMRLCRSNAHERPIETPFRKEVLPDG